jgi:hypothetical protein
MERWILLGMMAVLWTGCTKTTQGECPAPDDNIRWFYNQSSNGIMSSAGCTLCDLSVDESDYYAWTVANAAPGTVSDDPADATPCLYVYPNEQKNWDSAAECAQMACSEDPNTNDGVKKWHGTWKIIHDKLFPTVDDMNAETLGTPVSLETMASDPAMDPLMQDAHVIETLEIGVLESSTFHPDESDPSILR